MKRLEFANEKKNKLFLYEHTDSLNCHLKDLNLVVNDFFPTYIEAN